MEDRKISSLYNLCIETVANNFCNVNLEVHSIPPVILFDICDHVSDFIFGFKRPTMSKQRNFHAKEFY